MPPGFPRGELKTRYDVASIDEDEWHRYSGTRTSEIVAGQLASFSRTSGWLLNAGAGVYKLEAEKWDEISLDIFLAPIKRREFAVCGSVERLPFANASLSIIVCVGEVLAYCDPALAISEFARTLVLGGMLIFDFGSSRSFKYALHASFGRAADLVTDWYNGSEEKTWVYDPKYIATMLASSGFQIGATYGTHSWSALARRFGASHSMAVGVQQKLDKLRIPGFWSDLTTFSAVRAQVEK